MCGNTQIPASNLRAAILKLEEKGPENISGFEAQFHVKAKTNVSHITVYGTITYCQCQVLEQVCPKPSEVLTVHAMRFSHRNRNLNFLPCKINCHVEIIIAYVQFHFHYFSLIADRWRVPLKGESPDYIHASFVNVQCSASVHLHVIPFD